MRKGRINAFSPGYSLISKVTFNFLYFSWKIRVFLFVFLTSIWGPFIFNFCLQIKLFRWEKQSPDETWQITGRSKRCISSIFSELGHFSRPVLISFLFLLCALFLSYTCISLGLKYTHHLSFLLPAPFKFFLQWLKITAKTKKMKAWVCNKQEFRNQQFPDITISYISSNCLQTAFRLPDFTHC